MKGTFATLLVVAMGVGLIALVIGLETGNFDWDDRESRAREQHPDWPEHVFEAIAESEVFLGMTEAQVRASWGKPDDIDRLVTAYGVSTTWTYTSGSGAHWEMDAILRFNDGILSHYTTFD